MSFKENNYIIIRAVISKELSDFCYDYFLLKRKVAEILFAEKIISPFNEMWGVWNDQQVPETYSHYADIVMETLLTKIQPIMEKQTELTLIPNYSYARIYKKGDILKRHKDRFSCEISTTLNLGGDKWPIFLEPEKNVGVPGENGITFESNNKGIEVDLEPGDMLVYKGNILEHWREVFEGENCGQVFLHYNDINTPGAEENKFDKRPFIGLPSRFKK
jgi:hypothetical protein